MRLDLSGGDPRQKATRPAQVFEFWPPRFAARLYCPIKHRAKLDWYYIYSNGKAVQHDAECEGKVDTLGGRCQANR